MDQIQERQQSKVKYLRRTNVVLHQVNKKHQQSFTLFSVTQANNSSRSKFKNWAGVSVNLQLLGAKYLVDSGTWSGVEEEDDEGNKEEEDEEFEQLPLEVLPDDVLQGLQWVHEPQERRVGATTNTTGNVHKVSGRQQTHCEKCAQGVRVTLDTS